MDWTIVAPISAVFVTAVLGALGISREQSVMRQLERVTAVLKDMPDNAEGRRDLEWLQTALARRVNNQYRAPRMRDDLAWGWLSRLSGWGLSLILYVLFFHAVQRASPSETPSALSGWITLAFLALIAVGSAWAGSRRLRRRVNERQKWIVESHSTDSAAPML